jgi:hypothetical protein
MCIKQRCRGNILRSIIIYLSVINSINNVLKTVIKIFGKYMNISNYKFFTIILYFYCTYNELPVCKHKCFITLSFLDSDWSEGYYGFIMMFVFYLFNTFSDRNTGPKVFSRTFLDFKLACGGTLDRSFFLNRNCFSRGDCPKMVKIRCK